MKKRLKILGLIAVLLLVLGGAAVWILLAKLPGITAEKLSKKLNGASVHVTGAKLGGGKLELRDVRVSLPEKGEVIRVEQMDLVGTLKEIYRGDPSRIEFFRPTILAAADDGGQWNFGALAKRSRNEPEKNLPGMSIVEGKIEIGKNPWGIEVDPIWIEVQNLRIQGGKVQSGKVDLKIKGVRRGEIEAQEIGANAKVDEGKISFATTGKFAGATMNLNGIFDPSENLLRAEAKITDAQLSEISAVFGQDSGRSEGKVTAVTTVLAWMKPEGTKVEGKLSLSGRDKLIIRNRMHATTLDLTVNYSAVATKNQQGIEIQVDEITGSVANLELGWPIDLAKLKARATHREGKLEANIEVEVVPPGKPQTSMGKLQISVAGPLWPKPKLEFGATLTEVNLERADTLITDTTMRGALTASLAGEATWTWEEGKGFSLNRDEPLLWGANGEATLESVDFKTLYYGNFAAEGLTGRVPFEIQGINNRPKGLRLSQNKPLKLKVAKIRQGDDRMITSAVIKNAWGEFPLRGEEKFERTKLTGDFSAESVSVAGANITGIHVTKFDLEEGTVRVNEAKIATVADGNELRGKEISVRDLTLGYTGEGDLLATASGSAQITAREVEYGRLVLSEAATKLTLDRGVLEAKELHAAGYAATFDGLTTVNLTGEPTIEMSGKIKNLNLHQFIRKEKIEAFDVDGLLSGDVRLRLHGVDWDDLHEDDLEIQLASTAPGRLFFAENDWMRDLKKKQPALEKLLLESGKQIANDLIRDLQKKLPASEKLLLEGGNEIAYDSAQILLRRKAHDLIGEFSFRGPKVVLTIPLQFQGGTLEKLIDRLKRIAEAKIGGTP